MTELERTIKWFHDLNISYYSYEWKNKGDEMVSLSPVDIHMITFGTVDFTFRNGIFDGFEVEG